MKTQKNKKVSKKTKAKNRSELAGSQVRLRFSRHVLPPLAGLMVAILFFGFFDSQLLSGRIEYYLHSKITDKVSNAVPSPTSPDESSPARLVVNRLHVNVPVIFEASNSSSAFRRDLLSGVIHYPGTALPGQLGNVVIFGPSSGEWWAPGKYKFVFNALNKVVINDKIYLDYQGKQYAYNVYNTTVVPPDDLSALNQTSSYTLTLMTSAPVGTDSERLVVIAQQYLPAVSSDFGSTQPASLPAGASGNLPGNESSFWYDLGQRL